MKPALDNSLVDSHHVYKTNGNWYISFYDKNDEIMVHNIELITPDYVYRENGTYKWIRTNVFTKWGANRIAKKFLAGQIPDFKFRTRPLP